jgi:hypothetical protein
MTVNPYESPSAESEAEGTPRPRRRFWRGLLIAYVVHHGFFVLGTFVGIICMPSTWSRWFPPEQPWRGLLLLILVPICDVYVLLEPLGAGEIVPATFVGLRWVRSGFVVTVFAAMVGYAISRRRTLWWYLAVMSFLLALSLIISFAFDNP